MTLLWPRIALIPPVALIVFRTVYGSREAIADSLFKLVDTVKGFWFGYVIEPVRGILDTVRTGGDESARIVNKEGVEADKKVIYLSTLLLIVLIVYVQSLERMAISLTKDKLSYNQSQLDAFAERIRQGDLTPVQEIYENDIKFPIRSAISGTLIRSLLIQIQKAKASPHLRY